MQNVISETPFLTSTFGNSFPIFFFFSSIPFDYDKRTIERVIYDATLSRIANEHPYSVPRTRNGFFPKRNLGC